MLSLPWFPQRWSERPNGIDVAPRNGSPWQQGLVVPFSASILALVWTTAQANVDYQISVKEKCTEIQGADDKTLHEAGQATARSMRDAYNEADRIAGELADLDEKVRKAAQEVDKLLSLAEATMMSIRRKAATATYDIRYWRAKLNETRAKIRPLQERLDSVANPYGDEQAGLKEQVAALKKEQKGYEVKFAAAAAKLDRLKSEALALNRWADDHPELVLKRKAEFESAKAERKQKFEEFEDAKAAAKTALLIHNGVKACIDKRKAELEDGLASTEDIVAASKSALQELWGGHAVLFEAIKKGSEALPDRYKASVVKGKKYYSHTIFVIPGDKVEKAKQQFREMIQQGVGEDGQTLRVDGLEVGIPSAIPTMWKQTGQFQTEFIGKQRQHNVVAKRRAAILCGRLVIRFVHYQDTGYEVSQNFASKPSKDAVDWHRKHPATPAYNRLKPQVKAETERYVRSLVGALRQAKACGKG